MIIQTSVAFNRDLFLIVPIVIQAEIDFQRLTFEISGDARLVRSVQPALFAGELD